MNTLRNTILTCLALVVLLGAGFALSYSSWASFNFFAPKYEETRRKTFEQSNTYNAGMVRDLENLQMEYMKGDDAQKAALKSIVLHRFSVYPEQSMPDNLRNFYNQLKGY